MSKQLKDTRGSEESLALSSQGQGKVVVVTGASSGFGFATANLLAEHGYTVFGTSRSPRTAQGAFSKFALLELDVSSEDSVNKFVAEVLAKTGGRIDVLVNNAGWASVGALEEFSIDEARTQLDANLFGAARMVKGVLPAMRKRSDGQVIMVGSVVGDIPVPFSGFYSVSKSALAGFTEQLRMETKNLGIRVSLVKPGFFRTNLVKVARSPAQTIEDYRGDRTRADEEFDVRTDDGGNPQLVARTILKIIESPSPNLSYPVGMAGRALFFKRILPYSRFERSVRKMYRLDVRS